MNEPNPPITGQAAKLTTSRVHDADETTLVCVVHLNASPVYAECRAVTRAGASRQIGRTPNGWRFDSVSAEAFDDGTVRMWLSCWPDNESGTHAAVRWIDFPDAVQPFAQVTSSGFVPAPNGYIRIKSVSPTSAPFEGQETVQLATHGIPAGVALLNIKLTTAAAKVGARGRVGPHTDGSGAAMLFEQTQVVGNRMCGFLQTAPGQGHTLILWADAGPLTEFYVDVLGWWY